MAEAAQVVEEISASPGGLSLKPRLSKALLDISALLATVKSGALVQVRTGRTGRRWSLTHTQRVLALQLSLSLPISRGCGAPLVYPPLPHTSTFAVLRVQVWMPELCADGTVVLSCQVCVAEDNCALFGVLSVSSGG